MSTNKTLRRVTGGLVALALSLGAVTACTSDPTPSAVEDAGEFTLTAEMQDLVLAQTFGALPKDQQVAVCDMTEAAPALAWESFIQSDPAEFKSQGWTRKDFIRGMEVVCS